MKHIAYSLAVLAATSLSGIAVAAPIDAGDSVLTSTNDESTIVDQATQAINNDHSSSLDAEMKDAHPAPLADPSDMPADHSVTYTGEGAPMAAPAPVAEIPQPIAQPMAQGTVVHQQSGYVHSGQPTVRYYRTAKKKQNVFQKLMELERRKNAWLKKTFLGK